MTKNSYKIFYIAFLWLSFFSIEKKVTGQVEFGVGIDFVPYTEERTKESKKEPVPKNNLIENISIRFNQNYDKLYSLYRRGYGYTELIKLLLIAEKSNKPLVEIVKLRDKKEKISKIATAYGLDYKEIYFQAHSLRTELESATTQTYTLIPNTTDIFATKIQLNTTEQYKLIKTTDILEIEIQSNTTEQLMLPMGD